MLQLLWTRWFYNCLHDTSNYIQWSSKHNKSNVPQYLQKYWYLCMTTKINIHLVSLMICVCFSCVLVDFLKKMVLECGLVNIYYVHAFFNDFEDSSQDIIYHIFASTWNNNTNVVKNVIWNCFEGQIFLTHNIIL